MTPEQWKRVDELFTQATEMSEPERDAWLQQQCAAEPSLLQEVRALLVSDQQGRGFVEGKVESGLRQFHADQVVKRAGPYVLTRELGRGGMGSVYLGQRDDGQYQADVAVKLIRPGMDTDFFLLRFKRERQALARLRHPSIARLLDSGTTDEGLPYIVMERVDGIPINAYCATEKLGLPQILRLYMEVCRAVAHAHRNFVVHRDLKPGNILVEADGTPKLLDFGICKLLLGGTQRDETDRVLPMMTPDYASPEQVSGDPITVASDVYSLGAVLYDLLTGKRPHVIEKYTPQLVAKAVCETEVLRPSAVAASRSRARELEGDLDTILLKALQKDPQRRYASVEQFAEDLRRVLDDEPVTARPDTMTYRAGKFMRRHRAPVAAAIVTALSLIGGLIAYRYEAASSRQESTQARQDAAVALTTAAGALLDANRLEEARTNLESAIAEWDKLEAAPSSARTYEMMAALETRSGRPDEARRWEERARAARAAK